MLHRPGRTRSGRVSRTFPEFNIAMLDANLKTQLKAYLEKVSRPIEIVASLDDSDKSRELQDLLHEIATLSDRIAVI